MTRSTAAVAVALVVVTAPAADAASPTTAEVLVLAGTTHRSSATTSRPTSRARWYTITVGGVVGYAGRLPLEDCGHRDGSDEVGWTAAPYPLVDGVPSPCTRMPTHASHTYCWRQRGTGHPLVFSVAPYLMEDDFGALVVTVDNAGDAALADLTCPLLP